MNGKRATLRDFLMQEGAPRFFTALFLVVLSSFLNSQTLSSWVNAFFPTPTSLNFYIMSIMVFALLFTSAQLLDKKFSQPHLKKIVSAQWLKVVFKDIMGAMFYLQGALGAFISLALIPKFSISSYLVLLVIVFVFLAVILLYGAYGMLSLEESDSLKN